MINADAESAGDLSSITELSLYELVGGILLYLGSRKLPEQALLRLFREIQEAYPTNARRFSVTGAPGHLVSKPLRRTLSFLEIYKALEVFPPNHVDQFYRLRPGMKEPLRGDLIRRSVLPRYESELTRLASRLSSLIG